METIQVSTYRCVDKQNAVYTQNRVLFERKEILIHAITWMKREDAVLNKINQS